MTMTAFSARRTSPRPMATKKNVDSTPVADIPFELVSVKDRRSAAARIGTLLANALFFLSIQVFSWGMLICAFQGMWWHAAGAGLLAIATFLGAVWWPRGGSR